MMAAISLACGMAAASAATWIVTPAIGLEETLTNNVKLAPADAAQADLVTQLSPSLTFSGRGAHAKVDGTVSVPILLYVRTGAENNYVYPTANIVGNVEAIDKFFYVEGAAFVCNNS
jgi:uncharacterized protein (PEP-CTERM system associated)